MAQGVLRVVSESELQQADAAAAETAKVTEPVADSLLSHIRDTWWMMRDHRHTNGMQERLLAALRMFNGEYDPSQLAEIQKFGGSMVYARLVAAKCRGATALLRDLYFSADKPWELAPTPNPTIPDNVREAAMELVKLEARGLAENGMPIDPAQIQMRLDELLKALSLQSQEKAEKEAARASDLLNDYLVEGEFYDALSEFLVDLPLFPFACIKGPEVRITEQVAWVDGRPTLQRKPQLFWRRVSPFDVYFTPGASNIQDAEVCERLRWTRRDLNDLLGLPGWDDDAIRGALREYDHGLRDWMDPTDHTRADQERREDPDFNRSEMIDALEFHGYVRGAWLLDWGMSEKDVPDEDRDYAVQAWVCGSFVLKVQLSTNPRKRHPYYVTSYEKVPGTPVGNALPDMLTDIQEVANATLRSLVNNEAMASGPQVVVNEDLMAGIEDADEIYPWKRWHITSGLRARAEGEPVKFFQPQSNAQELLYVYQQMTQIADEVSAIPRYITGSGASGGAGRTASGLSMLMGNANKLLAAVAANVDREILQPMLHSLYEMVLLTQVGDIPIRGDEKIRVKGVSTAMQREVERARQLEFLSLTANPLDLQITGPEGRAEVLRQIADDLGMPGHRVVPTKEALQARMQQQMAAQQAAAQAQGQQKERPGGQSGPMSNTVQPQVSGAGFQAPKNA